MDPQTTRVLQFLAAPSSYPHQPHTVHRLQTHASWVFIAPPFVYKIKKPVDLGFLNFSTLESRRINCESEVLLNRRLAADVYLGVLAVRKDGDQLTISPVPHGLTCPPNIIEYIVHMRLLPQEGFLLHRLRTGNATDTDFNRVIDKLLEFYRNQPPLTGEAAMATVACTHRNIEANLRSAQMIPRSILPQYRLDFLQTGTASFETKYQSLLCRRARDGWIRDCHGDLHLEHIHISVDHVRIYDCLEFDDSLRQIDIACDIAFLAMDLDFHLRTDWSQLLIQRLTHELTDPDLPLLIRWYQAYRACVRGKVEYLRSISETVNRQEKADAQTNAERYFLLAARYLLSGNKPRILAFAGQSASGKSLLAEFAAKESGWPLFSSDKIRKSLAEVPLFHRVSAADRAVLYSTQMTQSVYATMRSKATEALNSGHSVILDATFSSRAQRLN